MERILALYHKIIALIAVVIYGYPARSLKVIAVTGTSGKTTTAHLIYWILHKVGKKVSLISSVEAIISGKSFDTGFHVTTPSSFAMQKFLRKSVNSGDKYIVIEASSHGIAQGRMIGTNILVGLLTNIAHEHLDYHKTFQSYANAKLSIITNSKIGIVNRDDSSYAIVKDQKNRKCQLLTYSLSKKEADYTLKSLQVKSKFLPGDFNKQNMLAAASVVTVLGVSNDQTLNAIELFRGVTGRFEEISNKKGLKIIVDFAHKPNALAEFLKTVRKMTKKRIIVMFGSAGERDRGKRSMMGEIAAKYVDIGVLTAEDPRGEDVNDIIEQIFSGIPDNKRNKFIKIPSRSEAIDTIINKIAKPGDTVAFLGKSHEKSMCYGSEEYPWSEHEQIYKALARK